MMDFSTLPTLKEGYQARPCTLTDVQDVVDLKNACAIKATGKPDQTVEETLVDWQRPGFDPTVNQWVVLAADGTVVGWSEVSDAEVMVIQSDIYVHPDYEAEGIGEYLMAWMEARARQV